jgi:ABC-type tungstate transport system permease subunit/ABC-type tungstate transport system substrate-binding protein
MTIRNVFSRVKFGRRAAGAGLGVALLLAGCGGTDASRTVVVGSTTSLYDTGLLDTLVAAFETGRPDLNVRVLSVGTGQALELGRRGDADLLLVHSPPAELVFIRAGHGRSRTTFMRNDFVIAGPAADPAGIRDLGDPEPGLAALRRIASAEAPFVSRGDDSGTHMKELALWEAAGAEPAGDWYLEAGQGMGATLTLASERKAYVLTDRSTLTVLADVLELSELITGGKALENLYSVMETTAGANPEGAAALKDWLLGDTALDLIRVYGEERLGRPLFEIVPFEPESQARSSGSRLTINPFTEAWALLTSADAYVWEVVFRSLSISGAALLLATLIGLPLGAALALSRFRFRTPVVALVNTGLAFPPVVVGLAVYLLLSRSGPLGPLGFLYTPWAVILAQVILAGPYIAAVTLAALEGVPPDVRQQARGLGANRWQATLLHLREARASLVAAVAAGFGAVISEVGAVMIVGGNLLGETRVMTTAIVLETRKGNFGVAIALGIVLLAIAFLINLALTLFHGRGLRRPVLA